MERPPFGMDGIDEDAVLAALAVLPGDHVVVADGVGDVALALVAEGAVVTFVAADAGVRALAEARRACLEDLPVGSARSFLGLAHFGRRVWFYHYLRGRLTPEARGWLDAREQLVREGLVRCGVWEGAFLRGAALPGPLAALSRRMALLRAAPELGVPGGGVGAVLRRVRQLADTPGAPGRYARHLVGEPAEDDVPRWLRADVYARLRGRGAALRIVARPEDVDRPVDVWIGRGTAPSGVTRALGYVWEGGAPLAATDATTRALGAVSASAHARV